jgi:Pregnancy-associated plasma protein-A/Secretion system C-terminal sorting domain
MRNSIAALFLLFLNIFFSPVFAQKNRQGQQPEQCATMVNLEAHFKKDPSLKARFNQQLQLFNKTMEQRAARQAGTNNNAGEKENAVYTIPVVFHIVLTNPSVVTDAQIAAQLDVINKDYAGTNTDAANLPDYFKPIFGKSSIRFCLAQRTPDGDVTTGIDRVVTTLTSFSPSDNAVKHTGTGGADIWDGSRYLNVWVCPLSNSLLGYGTFPNDGVPDEQGVVMEYGSLPGGRLTNYNGGKTLTHEIGHYLNLFHTWGDDNGACDGSDFVDDTPNQADASSGCATGVKKDSCTPAGNGVLYQDYMDYSYDQCLILFTAMQADRMQTALLTYRSSLTVSDGCTPPQLKNTDAQLRTILAPEKRICNSSFTPVVTIWNKGVQTLTSLVIKTIIDNGTPVSYNWTGTLNSLATANITLTAATVAPGIHTVKIFTAAPNGATDENNGNDTLTTTVQYFDAVTSVKESFEGTAFPPAGWDIVNTDKLITWKKATGIAKTGNASIVINNFEDQILNQQDYLRLPECNFVNVDSAFLTFQLAAATYTAVSTAGNNWDTLEVLISKDCGATYTSVYKKWGPNLVTVSGERTSAFVPGNTEWRRDSINLTAYSNAGKVLIAFRNTNGFENNIYLDDINVRTLIINPNLKAAGFLVTPNPATDNLLVQFYPNPAKLRAIQLYNLAGQKIAERNIAAGQTGTAYNFDIRRYPHGVYVLRAVFTDKVLTKKIVK